MSFAKGLIEGNLTSDPALSLLPSGTPVVEFSVAVNSKSGQRQETSFFDVKMFGKVAEIVKQYFTKGKPIFVSGDLKEETWQARDGTRRSKIRLYATDFSFVGGTQQGSGNTQGREQGRTPQGRGNTQEQRPDYSQHGSQGSYDQGYPQAPSSDAYYPMDGEIPF